MRTGFGVDIGGSGIKGAPVDLDTGELTSERLRIGTPVPSTPAAVCDVVAALLHEAGAAEGVPLGVTLPAVVTGGVARTAANIDKSWIGTDVVAALRESTGRTAVVVNDADAAGSAEVAYGAAKGVRGLVVVLTLGTGIGSALLLDGQLMANSELGHLELDGHLAESRASDAARKADDLDWEHWAKRLTAYLRHVELVLHPTLFVLGGGVSKKSGKWLQHVEIDTEIAIAALLNDAGIIGAAMLAAAAEG